MRCVKPTFMKGRTERQERLRRVCAPAEGVLTLLQSRGAHQEGYQERRDWACVSALPLHLPQDPGEAPVLSSILLRRTLRRGAAE